MNCTGVNSFDSILLAVNLFRKTYETAIHNFKIKAMAATSNLKSLFTCEDINRILKKNTPSVKISIVSNKFIGLMFRFSSGGAAQVFCSGKINFLGARNFEHLHLMDSTIRRLVQI